MGTNYYWEDSSRKGEWIVESSFFNSDNRPSGSYKTGSNKFDIVREKIVIKAMNSTI